MTIQATSGIESMLSQMRAVMEAASGAAARTDNVVADAGGFAAELARSVQRVSAMQNNAAAQARAFELGDPKISLNDVMIDMQKANVGFQATMQVRNRLVAAYQEIASMAV